MSEELVVLDSAELVETRRQIETTMQQRTRELVEQGRRPEGWAAPMGETPGKVTVLDMAAVRPTVFRKVGVIWHLVVRCRGTHGFQGCGEEILLPLEGEFEAVTVDGKRHPAGTFNPGMLTAACIQLAQRMLCEPCCRKLGAQQAAADKRDSVAERVRDSGISRELAAEATWETIITRGGNEQETEKRSAAIEACKVWAKEKRPKRGVLLYGPPGSGKTRLAATAALERLQHDDLKWVSVSVLMAQLQAGWGDEDRQRALKVLTGKGVLVLDDIDKLNDRSPAVTSALFAAIDARDQARSTMIVTTNLKVSELAKHLGDAITSRLMGMCNPRPYPGVDHRLPLEDEAVF